MPMIRTLTRASALLITAAALGACSYLTPRDAPRPSAIHTLDEVAEIAPADKPSCYGITVNTMRAAPGYGTSRMLYTRTAHRLESFAYHKWADSPSNMLHPLLVNALEQSNRFAAVLTPTAPEEGVLRLDTELVMLRQRFEEGDSKIELAVRARVFAKDQILASRQFRLEEDAGDGPESGVEAANRAAARFTGELVGWVDELVARSRPACH